MNTTMTDKTWIEQFTVELRLRRVPGPVIGDAVASVRELVADSGQSAEEAFGSAREYAESLDLPTVSSRENAVRTVLLPVLGLFTFLAFALASTAWLGDEPVLLSVPQVLLIAVPVVLTLLFAFPFYPRAVFHQRWLPAVLVLVAAASGALGTLLAPASASDAWLTFSALPLLIGTAIVLVVLSVIGTVATLRSRDDDEIVEPLRAHEASTQSRGARLMLIGVNWIFPILAVVVFTMAWGFSALRP